jgi:integrase
MTNRHTSRGPSITEGPDMPRKAKPWYRASRAQWYGYLEGKQVPLGISDPGDEAAALAVLRQLLSKARETSESAPPWADRVAAFVAAKEARDLAPKTVADYRRHLAFWLAHFGTHSASDLFSPARARRPNADPSDLLSEPTEASANVATWGENTRRNYLAAVETFLRWCGYRVILEKPGRESAGAGMVISEAVYNQSLGAATGDLRPLLVFLWNTGCRPSEASSLTAADVDWDSGTVTKRKHKTRRGSKGKPRVIYLSPAALDVLSAQREKYPTGLLFPNRKGTLWRDKALTQAVWRVAQKIGHRVTAYGCRHSYATRALEKGLPDTHVAALLGHGSTRMIHKHYSHLSENARLLKDAAAKVG